MAGEFKVIPAGEAARPVIANLLQLYLYDMAPYFGARLNAAGRYDHDILEEAWAHPYLFTLEGAPAGFALITRECTIRERSPCWYVAEFGILRPYQGRGLGRRAFQALLEANPGDWEVTWYDGNRPASAFWPRVIPQAGREERRLQVNGMDWTTVAFTV